MHSIIILALLSFFTAGACFASFEATPPAIEACASTSLNPLIEQEILVDAEPRLRAITLARLTDAYQKIGINLSPDMVQFEDVIKQGELLLMQAIVSAQNNSIQSTTIVRLNFNGDYWTGTTRDNAVWDAVGNLQKSATVAFCKGYYLADNLVKVVNSNSKRILGSEIYNPNENAYHSIPLMGTLEISLK